MVSDTFKYRILNELLPQYCDDPSRGWGAVGFKPDWFKLSVIDADDFLRGLDAGLIEHVGRGQYLAVRSAAKEQFFWEGQKAVSPRPVSLWLEPVITVAGLARLHFEFGWPKHLIGMQSKGYAFDLTSYLGPDQPNEYIACEVKKSVKELDFLIDTLQQLAADGADCEDGIPRPKINAYRKLDALRKRNVPIFWALGPNRASYVFNMSYIEGGKVIFSETDEQALSYR